MQINIFCIWAVSLGGGFITHLIWFGARIIDRSVETIDSTWPSCSLQLRWYIFLHRIVKTILKNVIHQNYDRHNGVVVRASASQSVDLGFIPVVEPYQKTLKSDIHSFPAWRSAFTGGCGEQAGKFACCALGQGTNGTSRLYVEDRWTRHHGNGNSQASANIPFKI